MSPATTPPAAQSGGSPAGAAVAGCPCPKDFTLDAPCKIVRVGATVQLSAKEIPGTPAGTYLWHSDGIHTIVQNAHSPNVLIKGLSEGSGKDSETITVTRTAKGCAPIKKTVQLTVAKVTFAASPNQKWGYDNYDTPGDCNDDHISIKSSDDTTVKVTITGGAVGTDFDFVCDSEAICKPDAAPGSASFDLKLTGGSTNKGATFLRAKVKCPSKEEFAKLQVHVYKELVVNVVVGKFFDSKSPGTALKFPNIDFAAFASQINAKAKDAVVKYVITNLDPAGKPTDVNYDLDKNGSLSFDIGGNGGTEFNAINAAFSGQGTKIRVAIVHDMKSFYYLKSDTPVGATSLQMTSSAFKPDRPQPLGTGANQENVTVTAAAGDTYTIHPGTTKAHKAGEGMEFPAAGWSSDPILIIEGNSSEDIMKWTVFHETGHRALKLADIAADSTTIMYYTQAWTDHRLRYCPRKKNYDQTQTENQWETVPRN